MIFLIPTGGIGNRLRSIKSAVKLAQDTKQFLKIIWVNTNDCPCDFDDLIENIEGIGVYIEIKNCFCRGIKESIHKMRLKDLYKSIYSRLYLERYKRKENYIDDMGGEGEELNKTLLNQIENIKQGGNVYIYSYSDFYGDAFYNEFRFNEELIKEAKKMFNNKIKNHYIGIHIRRGDNIEAIKCSPLELFEKKMEELLLKDPQIIFFVSTDDKEVLQYFLNKYKEKCTYYYDKIWERYTKKGQITAFTEMLCLSMTIKIYGSYYSSYSDIAANIGNIEKEVLRTLES